MITKTISWRRWAGSRSTLVQAINLATAEISAWNNEPALISSRIVWKDGTTDSNFNSMTIDTYSALELKQIKSIWIEIMPENTIPRLLRERQGVVFDFNSNYFGEFEVSITDEDRTRVEGLKLRINQCIDSGLQGPTWFSVPTGPVLSIFALLISGLSIMIVLTAVESSESKWVNPSVAAAIAALVIVFITIRTFPQLEILAEGEKSRFEKSRSGFVALIIAVIVSVVGGFILGWFS